jgi:tetratricopeptide (TPR) repeat protein
VHTTVPFDRQKVLQAAQKYVDKGRFDKAIIEYQKIVEEDPNDARTLLKIGDLQARSGSFEAAIVTYEQVGRYYASQGFSVKAIAVYKQIREIIRKHVPKLADQYGYIIPQLAQLYQDLGLTGDALAAYDEYATLLQRSGRDGEATEIFRKIVEINGSNPLARLRLAEALSRQGENEAAFEQFSMAAQTLSEMGRTVDVLKVYDRMLYLKPDPVIARQAAQMYLQRGQAGDGVAALAKLQICFQADNRDLDTLELLARAFLAIGQRSKSIEVRKEIVRTAREKGNLTVARKTLEELVSEAPDDDAIRAMARSLFAPASEKPPSKAAPSIAPAAPPADDAVIEVAEQDVDMPPSADYGIDAEPSLEELEVLSVSGVEQLPDDAPRSIRHVVVDDSLEVAEDLAAAEGTEARADTRQLLLDADAFRQHRLYAKAIETLQIGLEIDPSSIELRETLKNTLLEAGYREQAVTELLTIAAIHVDALRGQQAAQVLAEALQIDPSNQQARSQLLELGYQPPPSLDDTAEVPAFRVQEIETEAMRAPMPTVTEVYDTDFTALAVPPLDSAAEPLPSYDLEEMNASYAMTSVPATGRQQVPSLLTTDDPFGGLDPDAIDEPFLEGPARESPLPSFPLVDEEQAAPQPLPMADEAGTDQFDGYDGLEVVGPADEGTDADRARAAAPLAGTRGFQGGDSLEDALDEAEFFTSRGLFDDALAILQEQLQRFPNHPLLVERIREVREAASAAAGSGELAVADAPDYYGEQTEDRAFDIAASLEVLDGDGAGVGQAYAATVDVEEVFAKFKEGVKAQVSESDSATHYDLGVAYKEMGLHRDAIAEFEMAARDPKRACVAWSMIGMVHLDLGEADAAVEAFIQGLHAEEKTPEQENALYYELGNIYDQRSNAREALYYFEKVARRDPTFRDVAQRIRNLKGSTVRPRQDVASGEDDFDRAFDDLFTGSKM